MRNNELYHHGVKGMKWGVWNDDTKARYSSGQKIRKTPEERGFVKVNSADVPDGSDDAKWFKKATSSESYVKTYNAAVDVVNDFLLPKIDNEWKDVDISSDEVLRAKYDKQVQDAFNDALNTVGNYSVYNSPSGKFMISYSTDLKGPPELNLYSRDKRDIRAKRIEEAEDRARDRFNNDIDKLSDKFFESHGLSADYDLRKNPKIRREYDNWMMDQYDSYILSETSKIKRGGG